MLILGLNRGNHDASACLVRDGVLLHFINAERVTRKRHEGVRIWDAVRYCLEAAGAAAEDVDLVVQNDHTKDLDAYDSQIASQGVRSPATAFVRQFRKVVTISHHLAHAYAGIGLAPFEECAILVVDGIGQHLPGNQAEAETYYQYARGRLKLLHARPGTLQPDGLGFHSFDSLGAVYSIASSYLFGHWNYCGKVMGLAPYGRYFADSDPIIRGEAPDFLVDLRFRDQLASATEAPANTWQVDREASQNLARTVQQELERSLVRAASWLHHETRSKNLIVVGGVALNCVANQKILDESPFERVFVPPPAGDEGTAIGCAFYGWLELAGGPRRFALSHPYFGKHYGDAQVQEAIDKELFVAGRRSTHLEEDTARAIAAGRVVGYFQGASAMGPRALGDRSILADARDPTMRDHLNRNVKHREPFRPYGASVLEEKADEFFHAPSPCPYMTFAVAVRTEQAAKIPAVVHVDGTCRIQTVRREDHPRFHRLLSAFYELTGIPLVINTSLNGNGEPIIETPDEAIRLFLNMPLDALVIEDHWVERRFGADAAKQQDALLHCVVTMDRPLELLSRLSPAGTQEHFVRSPSPRDTGLIAVSDDFARLLRGAMGGTIGAALQDAGIEAHAARAAAVLDELTKLHNLGALRLRLQA